MSRLISVALAVGLLSIVVAAQAPPAANPAAAGPARGARPAPPTRDPNTPGYVKATDLPDGQIPSSKADGNFIIGPTHSPAPEMSAPEGVTQGDVYNFTMESKDSRFYPGIAREQGTFGAPDPNNAAKLDVTTSLRRLIRDGWLFTFRSSMFRARQRHLLWAPMGRTERCSRHWTI